GPSTSTLTLTGSTDDLVSRDIRTGNTTLTSYSNVGFVQELGLEPPTQSTNYTVFSGLNDSGFTVALTGTNNNGIAAIQIVSADVIPEPASIALVGLGGLLLLRRRS